MLALEFVRDGQPLLEFADFPMPLFAEHLLDKLRQLQALLADQQVDWPPCARRSRLCGRCPLSLSPLKVSQFQQQLGAQARRECERYWMLAHAVALG